MVREIKVKAGDKVSQGDLILYLDIAETVSEPERSSAAAETAASSTGEAREVRVPDIGDFKNVPIIEVLVAPGDHVEIDTSLIVLESDKASMEVPSPFAGTIQSIEVKVGDPGFAG
ncbi:MAG: biotin/lipoyl-containing protein [Candidatus Competibacter sp.]